jgi:transcriptional regulator with XRE-family HTH domain
MKGPTGTRAKRCGRGTGQPHPLDIHIGKRIRQRRLFLGMNQEVLAYGLGLTVQQMQKFEAGANRVSASRLSQVAALLNVSVSYLFENYEDGEQTVPDAIKARNVRLEEPDAIALVRRYYAILDPVVRQQFLELVESVAASNDASLAGPDG